MVKRREMDNVTIDIAADAVVGFAILSLVETVSRMRVVPFPETQGHVERTALGATV